MGRLLLPCTRYYRSCLSLLSAVVITRVYYCVGMIGSLTCGVRWQREHTTRCCQWYWNTVHFCVFFCVVLHYHLIYSNVRLRTSNAVKLNISLLLRGQQNEKLKGTNDITSIISVVRKENCENKVYQNNFAAQFIWSEGSQIKGL